MALPRLIFVTGKGGTGKSTVAAAMATALSRERPTTLADLDHRQTAAGLVRASKNLRVAALSTRSELEAFIRRIVPIGAISRRMLKSRTFGYVTAALPGLEAFLLLERFRIMAGDAQLDDSRVVIDAPASGTALELLAVAGTLKKLALRGTLNRLAHSVETFLCDAERFGAIVTVAPEELALREALETTRALRDQLRIATVAAVVNRRVETIFEEAEIAALAARGGHAELAARRIQEQALAKRAVRELKRAGLRTAELPMMFTEAMGAGEIDRLAVEIASQLG